MELIRQEARQDRIAAAPRFVPPLLWVALITGGAMLVLYLTTFANPGIRPALQALLVDGVTTVAAVNLCVILFLDNPYSGAAGSIKPTSMELTLSEISRELQQEFPETPIPCDSSRNPRGEVLGMEGARARA